MQDNSPISPIHRTDFRGEISLEIKNNSRKVIGLYMRRDSEKYVDLENWRL